MRAEYRIYCESCKEVFHFGNLAPSVCCSHSVIVSSFMVSNLQVFIELGRKLEVNTIYPPLDHLQKLVNFCRRHRSAKGHPGRCKVTRGSASKVPARFSTGGIFKEVNE